MVIGTRKETAMPSNGFIGGDRSVQWEIIGENVRSHNEGAVPAGYRHFGIDESDDNDPYFTVVIKLPQSQVDHDNLIGSLRNQLQQPGGQLTFRIPIEDENHGGPNHDQIQISWPSRPKSGVKI